MPKGWVWLLAYWSKQPKVTMDLSPDTEWVRDTALCPAHAVELDMMLKDLGREVMQPAEGSA